LDKAAVALDEFTGTGRRFEKRGEARGVRIFDDYAHHPTEIRATLAAARSRYPKQRIWAVWQPHTYSCTRALFDAFLDAFTDADEVIVTEIYPAREGRDLAFSASQIVKVLPHDSARFIPQLSDASDFLIQHLRSGDVLLVLSAGDADKISTEVLDGLK
jgi:UDP-N-acetylmuramate--alanine ligase